eukprot:gene2955-21456_t
MPARKMGAAAKKKGAAAKKKGAAPLRSHPPCGGDMPGAGAAGPELVGTR